MVYNIDKVDDGEPIAALRYFQPCSPIFIHLPHHSRVFLFHFRETYILFRQGDWKLVQRPSGTSDWIEEPANSHNPRFLCLFCLFVCLFERALQPLPPSPPGRPLLLQCRQTRPTSSTSSTTRRRGLTSQARGQILCWPW